MTSQLADYAPTESFLRIATACPEVAVGDVATNVKCISSLYVEACRYSTSLVVFPELSLTGYTLGDLVQHSTILKQVRSGLQDLAKQTQNKNTAMIVGFPFVVNDGLYNCAAVVAGGRVQGIVPKVNLPNYKEFYEKRWFQTWCGATTEVSLGDQRIPFGTDLLFSIGGALVGIEICEDLWVPMQPSQRLAQAGAVIIANPSASPEQIAKSTYRRQLVSLQSARLIVTYVYAGCDASESTTDIVMGGHQIIAEGGRILAERRPLHMGQRVTVADIDIEHLRNDRIKDTNRDNDNSFLTIDCGILSQQVDIKRHIHTLPFVPSDSETFEVCENIITIQAQALATRLQSSGIKKIVLGLSGGLDSTLALLVAVEAANRLSIVPGDMIVTLTMPGEASSRNTQSNAVNLAKALDLSNEIIPIDKLCAAQLEVLGHDGITQDITYENVQARMRTSLLFNRANQLHGLVLGTGDLSEIALGWSTFNGDHMSHYNVNASIPKTLIKHLVTHVANQPAFQAAQPILQAILSTLISPELTRSKTTGISQETEKLIGPYVLHDFFLYYFIRWNDRPEKIAYLAETAFSGKYSAAEIRKWLHVFLERFIGSQWKRSVAADGPKVGSVSLSPRGDWRAPSDMASGGWLGCEVQ